MSFKYFISCYCFRRDVAIPVQSRICFIKFSERDTVGVAQHLTNVVFIDRALLVIPYTPGEMPDEPKAIDLLNQTSGFPNLIQEVPWPPHVKNEVSYFIHSNYCCSCLKNLCIIQSPCAYLKYYVSVVNLILFIQVYF